MPLTLSLPLVLADAEADADGAAVAGLSQRAPCRQHRPYDH